MPKAPPCLPMRKIFASHTDWTIFSCPYQTKKNPHDGSHMRGAHLTADDRNKKSAATRHPLRLKNLSRLSRHIVQLSVEDKRAAVQRCVGRDRANVKTCKLEGETQRTGGGGVFVRNELGRPTRVTTSCCLLW